MLNLGENHIAKQNSNLLQCVADWMSDSGTRISLGVCSGCCNCTKCTCTSYHTADHNLIILSDSACETGIAYINGTR
jgi:hypothetical protein